MALKEFRALGIGQLMRGGHPARLAKAGCPLTPCHRSSWGLACYFCLSVQSGLDQLVWADLCALLTEPEQVTQALARAHGGARLPQELQARQENLRRGLTSLAQQLERLTEAYLAGIVLLDEYRRRRSELERRSQALEEQQRQLTAQVDRREELAGLSRSVEEFCQRIREGLE